MIHRLKQLWSDESGISAIEYALLAAGVALAIATAITNLGEEVESRFNDIVTELQGDDPPTP